MTTPYVTALSCGCFFSGREFHADPSCAEHTDPRTTGVITMPVTLTKTAYTIDELSDAARAKALDAHREWHVDHDWWDSCYDSAADAAKHLGLDIMGKRVQLRNGTVRYDPAINFSGFWSQGDGASFEGSFTLNDVDAAALKADFGTDAELHAIADTLEELKSALTALEVTASITNGHGNYSHEYTMCIEVDPFDGLDDDVIFAMLNAIYGKLDAEENIRALMRRFARWIYRMLEQEYEYLTSDEAIIESLQVNDMLFDEDGDSI